MILNVLKKWTSSKVIAQNVNQKILSACFHFCNALLFAQCAKSLKKNRRKYQNNRATKVKTHLCWCLAVTDSNRCIYSEQHCRDVATRLRNPCHAVAVCSENSPILLDDHPWLQRLLTQALGMEHLQAKTTM